MIFTDAASGFPIASADIPEGFSVSAEMHSRVFSESRQICYSGSAASPDGSITLGFRSGESYTCSRTESEQDMGTRASAGAIIHHPCSAAYQLDEIASAMLGKRIQAEAIEPLTQRMAKYAIGIAQKQSANMEEELRISLSLVQTPMGFVIHQHLLDGGMGLYRILGNPERVLYLALFRCGIENSLVGGVNGVVEIPSGAQFGCAQIDRRTLKYQVFWTIPLAWYAVAPAMQADDAHELLVSLIESFEDSPELLAQVEQLRQANFQEVYGAAQASIRQNQALIDAMWQQQNAAWARVEQNAKSLSADLDSFRAGMAQQTAAMDARFAPAPSWTGGSDESGESLDDRVARWRHESMMGVNTYDREDGTSVEFSTQADRVFEQNLDPLTHVGTEHYDDDYIPDGWTELDRRY